MQLVAPNAAAVEEIAAKVPPAHAAQMEQPPEQYVPSPQLAVGAVKPVVEA